MGWYEYGKILGGCFVLTLVILILADAIDRWSDV